MSLKLIIGNKNYSSWSLRAWLFLKQSNVDFEEIRLALFTEQWETEIKRYTPAGKVPVLLDGDIAVWDSLAIMEYVRENYSDIVGWPGDRVAQAHARSIATEMHSGFMAIREELPQNLRLCQQRSRDDFSSTTRSEIERVETLWQDCFQRYGGPWLCGDFSIADVMYAPVALRFVTYGIELIPEAQQFVTLVQELDAIQDWTQDAVAEEETLPFIDAHANRS
ncbi:glutathione S-transferase family protein [Oscillatoria sp. CS-180]|uniref:glutathione S-transferase family protein n=1 Tax=Oscillatoria sp. CS-180 TaxID=3021720 RepID=UPI00232BE5FF|nr:glutathione S-transferase family protein [Oscillatoria sp. CS-180]MDB9528850.1 glutathione S-transferase family protein [Oscillatoria sp. CS-180]